jgi:hypothetical protein
MLITVGLPELLGHRPSPARSRRSNSKSTLTIPKTASAALTIPKKTSAAATSLWGRARPNKGMGSGGGTIIHRTPNQNLIITITQNKRAEPDRMRKKGTPSSLSAGEAATA